MKKTLLFLLVIALPFITFAQSNIGFNGVGARVGYVMPEGDIENTFGLGLNADLGTITPTISLEAFLDFWGKKYDSGTAGWEFSYTVTTIGAVGKYYFETSGDFEPYVGAGLGFEIASAKITTPAYSYPGYTVPGTETTDSNTELAIILQGGATKQLSEKMDGFAEVKYVISDIDYFGIYVGVMYKLK